jgi:hypothetical protein
MESEDSDIGDAFGNATKNFKILETRDGGRVKVKTKFLKGDDIVDLGDINLDDINSMARKKIQSYTMDDMSDNFKEGFARTLMQEGALIIPQAGASKSSLADIVKSNKEIANKRFLDLTKEAIVRDNLKGDGFIINYRGLDTVIPFQLKDGGVIEMNLPELETGMNERREIIQPSQAAFTTGAAFGPIGPSISNSQIESISKRDKRGATKADKPLVVKTPSGELVSEVTNLDQAPL